MSGRFRLLTMPLLVVFGCGGQVDTQVRNTSQGDASAGTSDASACSIATGSPCDPANPRLTCCGSGIQCGAQNETSEHRHTCCNPSPRSTCILKADCCGDLQCINGTCNYPTRNNSCDPVAIVGNGCPRDTPYCFVGSGSPVPHCFPSSGNDRMTGQSCDGNNDCAAGNICLAEAGRTCVRYCRTQVGCSSGRACRPIVDTDFGVCV